MLEAVTARCTPLATSKKGRIVAGYPARPGLIRCVSRSSMSNRLRYVREHPVSLHATSWGVRPSQMSDLDLAPAMAADCLLGLRAPLTSYTRPVRGHWSRHLCSVLGRGYRQTASLAGRLRAHRWDGRPRY